MRDFMILWIILLISIDSTVCKENAYAYSEDGGYPIGKSNLTEYRGDDVVSFTIAAPPGEIQVSQKAQRTEDIFKKEINEKINIGNQLVRDEGVRLVGRKSGAQRIDQICSIYDYMVGNWTYISDWRGLEVFQYSNYTLEMGHEVGSSGKGDCDDFAILLASLIDSIGGTPRIILANGPAGGHAYTEVYLGRMTSQDRDLNRILGWLRSEYHVKEIYCHTDPLSGDIWLNLDWWKDPGGANHPGGQFYQATTQVPINIRENLTKIPLTPIENLPSRVLFNYAPHKPEIGQVVNFNASQSSDPNPNGKIVDYEWNFGDGDISKGLTKSSCSHIYQEKGKFKVNLTITDSEGDQSINSSEIEITEPYPEAIFTYSPTNPKIGEVINFDASSSNGKRGQIIEYKWDFGDGYSGERVSIKHQYYDNGTYDVKLKVINNKGAENTSSAKIVVIQDSSPRENTPVSSLEGNPNPLELLAMGRTANEKDWYNKGIMLRQQGKYSEAIQAFHKALEINPQYALAWSNIGDILYLKDRYNDALYAYNESLKIDQNNSTMWYKKGNVLTVLERCYEAIDAYNKAIEINPQNADILSSKGDALDRLYRHDEAIYSYNEAIQAYDKAIKLNPQDAYAWCGKGSALDKMGRQDEAIQAYNISIGINPQNPNYYIQKGKVLDKLNRHDEAIKCFDKAIEIEPKNLDAWWSKTEVFYNLGKHDEARIAYKEYKKYGGTNFLYIPVTF